MTVARRDRRRPTCSMFQSMRSSTARTSLRDCRIGLPTSLVVSCAHSSASAARADRGTPAAARARSAYGRAAHAGCAARARATFCATSPVFGDRDRAHRPRRSPGCAPRASAAARSAARLAFARTRRRRAAADGDRPSARAGGGRSGAGARRSTGASSCIQRDFLLARAGARAAARSSASASRASVSSTSASDRNECQRSVRCLSSPGVCAPRSSSTPSSVDSGPVEAERLLGDVPVLDHALAGRLHPARQLLRRASESSACVDHRSRCTARSGRGSSTGCTR